MTKRWMALACAALLAACATGPKDRRSAEEKSTQLSPSMYAGGRLFPVGAIPDAVLHDTERNRDVAMAVDYPTRGGPYPVIIFSHGYGMSKESYTPLAEYWASHGYIVVRPAHADAGALRPILAKLREQRRAEMEKQRKEGRSRRREDAKEAESKPRPEDTLTEATWGTLTPADWANRARDVSFVIDSLPALEQKYPELAGRIERSKIGVAGHSLGAFTTMLVAGTVDYKTPTPISVGDPRVSAALAMSPQGVGTEQGLTAESWKNVKIPAMYMTGTLDRGAGLEGDPKWRHDPFAYSPAGNKYFVSFDGARHSTFTGGVGEIDPSEIPMRGERGTGASYPGDPWGGYPPAGAEQQRAPGRMTNALMNDRRIFSQVKSVSTAFFDDYLKGDASATDYMKPGGTLDQMNGQGMTVERK